MTIDLKQAVKLFYSQSSFDQIYQEAVANALDANAKNIHITFEANSLSDVKSFKMKITDDGVGFTEERFKRFSKLMNVEEEDIEHRGLGRLVYLFYFDDVAVDSYFDSNRYRSFDFNENLDINKKSNQPKILDKECLSGSVLSFKGYNLKKLRSKEFVDPIWIRVKLLKKFIIRLHKMKSSGIEFCITIESTIAGTTAIETITPASIPSFEEVAFTSSYSLDGSMRLFYSIAESEHSSVITAMSIDGRSEPIDVFAKDNEPIGYEMFFILYSDSFQGQTDPSRQKIVLSPSDLKTIQREFRKQIVSVLQQKLPKIIESQRKETERLQTDFPHLDGYFEENVIGICSRNDVVSEAQRQFMIEQRELIFKGSLSDTDYEKSLELAGRSLAQYVTFRQYIIRKLQAVDKKDKEEIIHNLIVPKREVIHAPNTINNIYKNNVWIFDDKFMTFNTVLSERETTDLLKAIEPDNTTLNIDRPDIAIIFSDNPNTAPKVDIVIIELKKKGLKPGENLKVEAQLEQRARALYPLYAEKIQTMWLYGVTELDSEYKATLDTIGYQPLYSKGTVFVNTNPITVSFEPEKIRVPAVRYVMDIDAVINDADARNKAFMDILRDHIKGEEKE